MQLCGLLADKSHMPFLVNENKAMLYLCDTCLQINGGPKIQPKKECFSALQVTVFHSVRAFGIPFFLPVCIGQASSTCQTNWGRLNSLCLGTKFPVVR